MKFRIRPPMSRQRGHLAGHLPERRKRGNFLFLFEIFIRAANIYTQRCTIQVEYDAYESGLTFQPPACVEQSRSLDSKISYICRLLHPTNEAYQNRKRQKGYLSVGLCVTPCSPLN
jgi:hypothetical protein